MEFSFICGGTGQTNTVVLLTEKQNQVVQQLLDLFPQFRKTRKFVEKTVLDSNDDFDLCVDILSNTAENSEPLEEEERKSPLNHSIEVPVPVSVPNDELDWKGQQLKESFPDIPLQDIIRVLVKNHGDFNDAATELLTLPNQEEQKVPNSETEFQNQQNSGQIQTEEDQALVVPKEEVFVVNESGDNFNWFLEAKHQTEEMRKINESQLEEDFQLALQLHLEDNPLSTLPPPNIPPNYSKKKKLLESHFPYEPPRFSTDPKLFQFFSPEAEKLRDKQERMEKMKLNIISGNPEHFMDIPENNENLEHILGNLPAHIPVNWTNVANKVRTDFHNIGYSVTRLAPVVHPDPAQNFYSALSWNKLVVVVCYHGTAVKNFSSIVRQGLKVPLPGSGIKVVNGSSFGLGIYLGINPNVSMAYARGGNQMLVCLAGIGNTFVTTNNGSILVITNNAQVLPCFVVFYEKIGQPQPLPVVVEPNDKKKKKIKM